MTQKQFLQLNEACCKFWIGLSKKDREDITISQGLLSVVDQMAELLCITINEKDYNAEPSRVDTICDNILAVEIAVFGKAALIEEGTKVGLVYPEYYIDYPTGSIVPTYEAKKHGCRSVCIPDGIRITGIRDNFYKLFYECVGGDYDKVQALMDKLKPVS